jgi:glycerol-3-phosphate O-acyltransferase
VLSLHLRHHEDKKDVRLVPVTINYDRVIEGEVFPLDLLGESPLKESFVKVVGQLGSAKKQIGKVQVHYGQPYSLRGHLSSYCARKQLK